MIEIHFQFEGIAAQVVIRRARLLCLFQLSLEHAQHDQRDHQRKYRRQQYRAARHRLCDRQNQRRDAQNACEYADASQQGFFLIGGHIARQLARLPIDGEGVGFALLFVSKPLSKSQGLALLRQMGYLIKDDSPVPA